MENCALTCAATGERFPPTKRLTPTAQTGSGSETISTFADASLLWTTTIADSPERSRSAIVSTDESSADGRFSSLVSAAAMTSLAPSAASAASRW